MKKFLIIALCVFVLLPLTALAEEPATELRTLLTKEGELIVQEYYGVEVVTSGSVFERTLFHVLFSIVTIHKPEQNQKVHGLRIMHRRPGHGDIASFLDFKDVKNLSKALEHMHNLLTEWKGTRKEYARASFYADTFKIGFFQEETEQTLYLRSSYGESKKWTSRFSSTRDLKLIKNVVNKSLKHLKLLQGK